MVHRLALWHFEELSQFFVRLFGHIKVDLCRCLHLLVVSCLLLLKRQLLLSVLSEEGWLSGFPLISLLLADLLKLPHDFCLLRLLTLILFQESVVSTLLSICPRVHLLFKVD